LSCNMGDVGSEEEAPVDGVVLVVVDDVDAIY
jgi:hypothetical protein